MYRSADAQRYWQQNRSVKKPACLHDPKVQRKRWFAQRKLSLGSQHLVYKVNELLAFSSAARNRVTYHDGPAQFESYQRTLKVIPQVDSPSAQIPGPWNLLHAPVDNVHMCR